MRFGVPVPWIERVMVAESGGRTLWNGRPTVSHAGAMGLMQLMPSTWAEMRRRLGLGRDPHAPRDNILAGTLYLRLMYDRFGYPGLFGAYNAGPARYAAYLEGRRALPGETRDYLRKVAGSSARWPAREVSTSVVVAAKPRSPDSETPAVQADIFFIRR
ncbi:MAG: lytic transglycosylase domain-containing protein [Sphingopyxis sp.]